MKLFTEKYEGYANTPTFRLDYEGVEFGDPVIIPRDCGNCAWFIAFSYDKSVLNYRLLCKARSHGNPHYGCPEGGYESGWSSRVAVINKQFNYAYADVSSRGIELDKFLNIIALQYVGDVFITMRETDTDLEYVIEPYFADKHDSYFLGEHEDDVFTILHTNEPGFVEIALYHLTGHEDMYVWPDGDVHYEAMPSWKSDDCVHYPAK